MAFHPLPRAPPPHWHPPLRLTGAAGTCTDANTIPPRGMPTRRLRLRSSGAPPSEAGSMVARPLVVHRRRWSRHSATASVAAPDDGQLAPLTTALQMASEHVLHLSQRLGVRGLSDQSEHPVADHHPSGAAGDGGGDVPVGGPRRPLAQVGQQLLGVPVGIRGRHGGSRVTHRAAPVRSRLVARSVVGAGHRDPAPTTAEPDHGCARPPSRAAAIGSSSSADVTLADTRGRRAAGRRIIGSRRG